MVLSARRGQRGQGTTSVGRGLYVERLTAGSTAAARKCLLITRKIIIPPPDIGVPPDGPLYFAKKMIRPLTAGTHELHLRTQGSVYKIRFAPLTAGTHQLHLRTQGSASEKKRFAPRLLGPTSYTFARKEVRPGKKKICTPDFWDPAATSLHARKGIRKKTIRPLTAGTHQLHLRTQGSASGQKKNDSPPTAGTQQLHLRTQGSAPRQKKMIRPPDC